MTSFRKKYRPNFESPIAGNAPPVSVPPAAAELPPAVEPKPPEPLETQSPAEAAGASAIKARLAELERAEKLVQGAAQHHQRLASEPPQQQPQSQAIPAHVQTWIDAHRDFFQDPVKLAELQLATAKCARDGLTWDDANFVPSVERYLSQGNGQATSPAPAPMAAPAPAPTPTAAPASP